MKVIIELNKDCSIETIPQNDNEVKIIIHDDEDNPAYAIVNIDELKLALRKMTAK